MGDEADRVLRALTDDEAFRVMVANTTHTVRDVTAIHRTTGPTSKILSELITGTVLFRETMAPDLRAQVILREHRTQWLVDSEPGGAVRGLVQEVGAEAPQALLRATRTLPNGTVQQGIVSFSPTEGVAQAFMAYLQTSEQVTTMMALGARSSGEHVVAAGGYLLQLLPDASRGPLMVMTERLEDFRTIERFLAGDWRPETLLRELLDGFDYTVVGDDRVRAACWCSELSLLSAMASLGRSEIEELTRDGKVLEITCDYCRKEYQLQPDKLRGMLDPN